jgi:hypothetical protein
MAVMTAVMLHNYEAGMPAMIATLDVPFADFDADS